MRCVPRSSIPILLHRRAISTARTKARTNYRVSPISKPGTAPWTATITHAELEKLKFGYTAPSQDVRWECKTYGPDDEGVYLAKLARTMTGYTIFAFKIDTKLDARHRIQVDQLPQIKEIIWETDEDGFNGARLAYLYKIQAKDLCRIMMDVNINEGILEKWVRQWLWRRWQ